MNIKAQRGTLGFAFLLVAFFLMLALFATIEPFKESLDTIRDGDSLNCPGTLTFNQSDYDDDTEFERLVRRPTCFATGISMVYFIVSFLAALAVWVISQWRRIS